MELVLLQPCVQFQFIKGWNYTTCFLTASIGILNYSSIKIYSSFIRHDGVGQQFLTCRSKMQHKCSIILRSRDYGGHSIWFSSLS